MMGKTEGIFLPDSNALVLDFFFGTLFCSFCLSVKTQTDTRKEKVRCIYEEGHRNVRSMLAPLAAKKIGHHVTKIILHSFKLWHIEQIPLLGYVDLLN